MVHPREVDEHFTHGTVTNYWGGSSSATTHLLDDMHYHGLLRVARRDGGIRIYAAHEHAPRPADAAARDGADRRAGRRRRAQVRAAARREPVDPGEPAALRRAAVARRAEGARCSGPGSGSRTHASTASTGTGRPRNALPIERAAGHGAPAGAVRSGGLGSTPLRALLGLGLPVRGLHAGAAAQARLLRAAAAVARSRHRLGQRVGEGAATCRPTSATSDRGRRAIAASSGSSRRSWIACGNFSVSTVVTRIRAGRAEGGRTRVGDSRAFHVLQPRNLYSLTRPTAFRRILLPVMASRHDGRRGAARRRADGDYARAVPDRPRHADAGDSAHADLQRDALVSPGLRRRVDCHVRHDARRRHRLPGRAVVHAGAVLAESIAGVGALRGHRGRERRHAPARGHRSARADLRARGTSRRPTR